MEEPNTLNASIIAELGHSLLHEAEISQKKIQDLEGRETAYISEIKQLKNTISDLKSQRVRLEEHFSDVSQSNLGLLKEVDQMRNQLRLIVSSDKSYSILAEHYRTSILEVENLKQEAEKSKIKEKSLKNHISKLEKESNDKLKEIEDALPAPIHVCESAKHEREKRHSAEYRELKLQLNEALNVVSRLNESQDQIEALSIQNQRLMDTIQSLTKRNNELEMEREESIRMEKIAMEEQQMQKIMSNELGPFSGMDTVTRTRGRACSIANEFEELSMRKPANLQDIFIPVLSVSMPSIQSSQIAPPTPTSAAIDANEEFFHMSVQAMKVRFTIKNRLPFSTEKVSEKVFKIKSSTMFKEVKAQRIPFHEWYGWIKKELVRLVTLMVTEDDYPDPHQLDKLTKKAGREESMLLSNIVLPPEKISPGNSPTKKRACRDFAPQFWKRDVCKTCSRLKSDHNTLANSRRDSMPNINNLYKSQLR